MASSSSSYKQLDCLRIPIADIACATDNFSDANLIREGEIGKHYKGKLNHLGKLIDIVARRLDLKYQYGNKEFLREVTMLSTLKHDNLVSMIGFCDDNRVNIVVKKHEAKGSLDQYLSDPITLTWTRRLEVCVGMANALSYIHYDPKRNFSVVHRDIKSSKILLDDKWKPKLYGFELSMKIAASQRGEVHSDYVYGTRGYIDPIYEKTRSVSHKSDVYSFGVVLFEVMCGTTALITSDLVKKVLEKLEVEAKLDHGKFTDDERSSPPPTSRPGNYYDAHRKLQGMIDPDLSKQMGLKSFQAFSEIAYYCLKESQSERPDIHQVCIRLKKALDHQRKYENPEQSHQGTSTSRTMGEKLKHLEIPLSEIKLATENFAEKNRIGGGTYGDVYIAQLYHFDSQYDKLPLEKKSIGEFPKKRSTVAVKRIKFREDKFGEEGFLGEIEMLTNCKHPNIISLLGFCEEDNQMILVYEHASNGSLEDYLGSDRSLTNLSWLQRIKICIDIACGLNYLHTKLEGEQRIIHRDIKSGNILLGRNWEAEISDFGLSKFCYEDQDQQANKTLYTSTLAGTELYMDPEYYKTGKLKNETDIYSFGVVLFELMAGKFANDPIFTNENSNGIVHVARRRFKEGRNSIKEMLDPKLIEESHENIFTLIKGPDEESLYVFSKIAYQCVAISQAERPTAEVIIKELKKALDFQIAYRCLHEEKDKRPTTGEVLLQLKKALEFQDDYDVWKPKLPKDFEKLIQMSNSPEIYSKEKYEHLYYMSSEGILIQEGKVLVMFGINEERNVMISAHSFSYINHCLHKRQHIPESRFQGVVEMLDILNLNIKINTRTQLLSPDVVYGVYLVFKFCDPRTYSSKPLYVNLKYKNGSEISHAYFATWRDNEWMMIELWRFLNDKEDIVFEFLLESFSQSYYEDSTIYVEGIEFRDITNVKYEEMNESEKIQQILGSHTNTDLLQHSPTNHGQIFERFEHNDSGEKVFWLLEVDGKKHFMLSAKTTLNNYGNAELFKTTSSAQSMFYF